MGNSQEPQLREELPVIIQRECKVIVLGDEGVGKTRFVKKH